MSYFLVGHASCLALKDYTKLEGNQLDGSEVRSELCEIGCSFSKTRYRYMFELDLHIILPDLALVDLVSTMWKLKLAHIYLVE